MEFKGKVIVVTGGAKGIGRSCVEIFAARGGQVVFSDIDEASGAALADRLGNDVAFLSGDVRRLADMEAMARLAETRFGGLDIIVNNAAVALNGVIDEIDEERWTTVIDTNLTGFWRTMKACVPLLRRRGGGAVVNLSSVQGLIGFQGWPAYAAAKGAIIALTRQCAIDLAKAGIRVNAVAPGTIMTPMNEKIFEETEDAQALIDSWNRAHPIGRFGQPVEVAELVAFLASDKASFITGEIVRCDGGLAIRGE
ncbi:MULTISPECIES: SDR family NAD(P)-dependent oxidoreductase [unclassified Shinella]|uniref:SDR family NAD(P)-dependent oxidoreductase n=1 Tax=unclassified Shinella TaxID=2643062 RepID=UPI00225C9222|nr:MULTISPECIES: SDR family NAD(P)-dependent oxidoreductase [unclassified Shinella]MCO5138850.1 SDR family oxidoreductase [Shinella sp.]MDC7255688.1 SDR family oxidoreductase [Shinella sp. YE25]CAI0338499.1 Short-chain dehydrogenase [Rhizobiaceae bacterium]CAK7256943.1 Short-chain dehydrogenase [Shinella sp. WSC3-e]